MKPHFDCPVQAAINAVSGKWKVQIIWILSFGTLRFAKLRNRLSGISEKVLTDQLRQLEGDGIVKREVTPSNPPKVDYSLTKAGEGLIPPMEGLCRWGQKQFGIKGNLPRLKSAIEQ